MAASCFIVLNSTLPTIFRMTAYQNSHVRMPLRLMAGLLGLALVSGCGSSRPTPSPLESFTPKQAVSVVWRTSHVSGTSERPLSVAVVGNEVMAASHDGKLAALDLSTGQARWQANLSAKLSAAIGSDGKYAAVVTENNDLIVLNRGQQVWQTRLPGLVITAPLVAGERVFVQSVDRTVRGYDVLDGRWLWEFKKGGAEPLSLAQQGVLTGYRDYLIVGHGSTMIGINALTGQSLFQASLGQSRGTNEVERLADLIGPGARVGNSLCVRSFQLTVGCVDLFKGTTQWSKSQSGVTGVAAGSDVVVGADSSDRLQAWSASTGESLWRVDRFQHRQLSAPVVWSGMVVFGDADGQLHFLSVQDGSTLARMSLDAALAASPVAAGNRLVLQTRAGSVYAVQNK